MQDDETLCDTISTAIIENEINKLYPQILNLGEPKSKTENHSEQWNRLYTQICFWVILFSEKNNPSKDIAKYENEISECTRLCLDSFNPSRGKLFMHYLTSAISRTLNKAIKKDIELEQKLTKTNSSRKNRLPAEYNTFLKIWEEVFDDQQERTKKYDSALITAWLLKQLSKIMSETFTEGDIDNLLYNRRFTDKAMLSEFVKTGSFPSQQQTAAAFNRDKTDASREMHKLQKKFNKKLNK